MKQNVCSLFVYLPMQTGLGKTANWAIVLAQLHTDGVCRGVHPFMVQLRDERTHEPLAGIVIGEIGPKMGLKAADNGFLQLNEVRIPRNQMLMKNAQVQPDGTYIEPKSDKLTYGTMVFVRVMVIDMVAFNVARAATIAVRYSAVRRQSEIERGEGEVQILDYQAQQMKLFPAIAFAHAFKSAFVALMGSYKEVADDIELRGDLEQLGQLHAMSSGLKALCSELGSSVIETCRRATGGHGYLLMSGLPRLYAATVAACTYEGENTVLYLQTARYLLKCCDPCYPSTSAPSGAQSHASQDADQSLVGTSNQTDGGKETLAATKYLRTDSAVAVDADALDRMLSSHSIEDQKRNERICRLLIEVMKASSQRSLFVVRDRLFGLTRAPGAMSGERAWISCQLDLIQGAKSHLMHFLLSSYVDWVTCTPPEIAGIMMQLTLLLFYTVITSNFGDYLLVGLTAAQVNRMRDEVPLLLTSIRPQAVTLVDAFDFHDIVLMSSLGECLRVSCPPFELLLLVCRMLRRGGVRADVRSGETGSPQQNRSTPGFHEEHPLARETEQTVNPGLTLVYFG